MSKVTKAILSLAGVISVAWWMGGMMYFMLVAKHYRDEEKRADVNKNLATWVTNASGGNRMSKPEVKVHNPTEYPKRPADPLQGSQTFPNKWRSYYNPSGNNNPKRLGDHGWDN